MSDLGLVDTVHDLPPKWDGRAVEWKGWREFSSSARFHGDDSCHQCGAVPVLSNVGLVENPGEFYRKYRYEITDPDTGRRRLARGTKAPMYPTMRLVAYRCQCGHDEVWDSKAQEMWCLDESDYGDEGSVAPDVSGFPEQGDTSDRNAASGAADA